MSTIMTNFWEGKNFNWIGTNAQSRTTAPPGPWSPE